MLYTFLAILRKRRILLAVLLVLLTVAAFLPVFSAPLTESAALSAIPPVSEIGKYLVISMGDDANIGRAFQMSNSEIGADREVLSTANDPGCVTDGGFPNLLGVFGTRWETSTNPDSLDDHTPLFQGIDWSGEVALTSDNGTFDSSNSLVWADTGIQTVDPSPLASVSNTKYMDVGNSNCAGANIAIGTGVTTGNSFATLLSDLSSWKSYIEGLSAESSITDQSAWTNNSANDGAGGLITTYADALDTNSDGVIVVDFDISGQDFSVNNTDWIIDGTGNKLIILRLRNGSNMLVSNGTITLGTGGIANNDLGVIFYSGYEGSSSDGVFNFNNVVASGVAFWDLNAVGEGGGSINTEIVINNGQGCAQFISQKVNFQNNRWNRCAPAAAQSLDYGDAQDGSVGTAQDNYNTTAADNGPSHAIVANLRLGVNAPDADSGTLQNAGATADDTDNTDDEDGVTVLPSVTSISASVPMTVSVFNNTGADSTLACWVDFNRDGDFTDTGERAATTVSASASQQTANLTFTGFAAPTAGLSYLRCRLANASGDVTNPTGAASTGEVEDYPLIIADTPGSIGNYVWVDENSDGYQDTGEPGLPNVRVDLRNCSSGAILATTYTDAQGGYLFGNLTAGTYCVKVDATTVPAAMLQTPFNLPNADFGNQNQSGNGYQVILPTGGENLTADFGYNDNPTLCVDGNPACPDLTATIGDRVWVDANGNGQQEPAEVGISGVLVTLFTDPDGDGVYNTSAGTDTTDANGNYLFDGLTPGAYVVVVTPPGGYTQTGDPDDFGAPATAPDNRTTTPVVLAPGDVFLNADFGYQPAAAQNNSIGDTVWFDADADQIGPAGTPGGTDSSEKGIPGVTVALIKDLNNNGIWESTEPIAATTTTDANGNYLFSGLPDGSYLVWVNDTDNVLAGKTPTYDSNGGVAPTGNSAPTGVASSTVLGLSSVLNLGVGSGVAASNLNQDFGYTAPGQENNKGLIGDRVWLDIDGDGVQDANEPGIEGVQVTLRDSGGTVLGTTPTDENGNYYFGGLPAGTYSVTVTPPSGMSQTYDATPPLDHQSSVTIPSGGINLNQDFGYRGTGTVGDLVWRDLNADGNVDAGETGIAGVTLELYWDTNGNGSVGPGEPRVGSATTNGSGGYLFSGLPTDDGGGNAQFVVDVTDTAGLLAGYTHSLGTPNTNNNSQTDPYAVTLTPGAPNYLFADFGYYITPASLGNFVWYDVNNNGLQDTGEPGIDGVKVTLTAKYFIGSNYTFSTISGDDPSTAALEKGWYSFGNLLLDEDNTSSKTGTPTATQPVYTISVPTAPTGYSLTLLNQGGNDMIDADNPAGVDGLATEGQTNVTQNANANSETNPIAGYDFGYFAQPYALSKRLNSVSPIRNGEPISFTIRITNTGVLTLTTVPLTDTYDTNYLTYTGSTPSSENNVNDGTINWNDLTSTPNGFGVDLAAGQNFVVIVNFVGIADTTALAAQTPCADAGHTCNVATASGVKYDPDGPGPLGEQGPLPPKQDWDDVQVIVPTSVSVVDAQLTYAAGVHLQWRTVNESDILGFHIYRSENGSEFARLTEALVPAQKPGQSDGARYAYTDGTVEMGKRYGYALEFIGASGALGQEVIGEVLTGARIFLPNVGR